MLPVLLLRAVSKKLRLRFYLPLNKAWIKSQGYKSQADLVEDYKVKGLTIHSGLVLSTGDHLIVTGDLTTIAKGMISFSKLVDNNNKAAVGDKIVTSNISEHYLPGILIGYISNIEIDSNNLTKSGTLTTAVDFEHLEDVLVIMELKQTVE